MYNKAELRTTLTRRVLDENLGVVMPTRPRLIKMACSYAYISFHGGAVVLAGVSVLSRT